VLHRPVKLSSNVRNSKVKTCSLSLGDRLCGLVVRVHGYRTEMYWVTREVRTEFMWKKVDRLCGLVVRVPGYRTEMYWVTREVRTEFVWKKVDRLCGLVVRVPGYRSRGPGMIPGATRFSEK
jgi:hypothetical protein